MNKLVMSVALMILTASFGTPVRSATQTVTLSVPGMTCAACPITVTKALTRVTGVTSVAVDYRRREAVVTFDAATTDVRKLTRATEHAGYPSTARD